jgi:hypothetical protein
MTRRPPVARDPGLEQLVAEDLAGIDGLTTTTMFGGLAWMWQGHLLCGARSDGMLARLGKGNEAWALSLPGTSPMMSGARVMQGWVRLTGEATADDATRQRLLTAAQAFVSQLPPSVAKPPKR